MAKKDKASHTANDDALTMRRIEALRLRVESRMSMREIATHLGVSLGTVQRDIRMQINEEQDEADKLADHQREIEARRLDLWLAKACELLEECRGDAEKFTKVMSTMLRNSERRAKLLGLDAPNKAELTGKDGGPVMGPVIYIPPEDSSPEPQPLSDALAEPEPDSDPE